MKKDNLTNFIKKYYLNGRTNTVVIEARPSGLYTIFADEEKSVIGMITSKNDSGIGDIDTEFGVYNTKRLLGMINLIEDDGFNVELNIEKEQVASMKLSDSKSKSEFMLSPPSIIKKPKFKMAEMPKWDIIIELDNKFVSRFVKTLSVLEESKFTVASDGETVKLILGVGNVKTDTVKFDVDGTVNNTTAKSINFSASALKEIFSVNSDFGGAKLHVSYQGISFLEFTNDDFECKYYLLALNSAA